MKIPNQLKIGGHIYKVVLVDAEDIDNCAGEQNNSRSMIKLRRDLPQTQLEATLIHEILHAINISVKEQEIEFWAESIYQVLHDNKLI